MAVSGGPYLQAAFFCEKVLREIDGVTSFIRVVDRWTVTGPSETMPPTLIQNTLVVQMKSGIHRGSSQLVITPTSPSGQMMPALTMSVLFEGDDDRGIALIAPMAFPAQEPGLYWFELTVDGRSFTQLPLRIVYLRVAATQFPSQSTPGLPSE